MKYFILALACATVVQGALVKTGHRGPEGLREKLLNLTCQGEPLKQTMETRMAHFQECEAEIKNGDNSNANNQADNAQSESESEGNKDGAQKHKHHKKNPCVAVCVMKKAHILTADGKYDEQGAVSYFQASFPSKVQDEMKKEIDTCAKTHASTFKNDDCSTYMEFMKCKSDAMVKVCGIDVGGFKKGFKGRKGDH